MANMKQLNTDIEQRAHTEVRINNNGNRKLEAWNQAKKRYKEQQLVDEKQIDPQNEEDRFWNKLEVFGFGDKNEEIKQCLQNKTIDIKNINGQPKPVNGVSQ